MPHDDLEPEPRTSTPALFILSIFLALLLVVSIVPYYAIKYDPQPDQNPDYSEVIPDEDKILVEQAIFNYGAPKDYRAFINATDPVIKEAADKIVLLSGCKDSSVCNAKAIFAFVRDHMRYVSDPATYEYIKTPREALRTRTGDCDDAAVLLSNLLQSIGIHTRFVFIPGHVYVQAKIPEALKKYQDQGWINLDATCTHCQFGEIPWESSLQERQYIEP